MSKIISSTLGEICRVINGRAYKQTELQDKGKYKVLRVGNFFSNSSWYYSDLELGSDKYCLNGDLLFAWSASFGPRIWDQDKTIYHYHIWKLVENSKFIDKTYLYYFLHNSVKKMMHSTHGSIMLHLTKKFMEELCVNFPANISHQKTIASVLSSLDEKININNRINTELEVMAKTLYDYWFVQFDFPDANGKPYKNAGGKMIYNLTLKREIPVGWIGGTASTLLNFNPTTSLKAGAVASYIDMDSLPVKGFMTKKPAKKEFAGGVKFKNYDVAVARITPCLENGKTALISRLPENKIGFGSTEFIILRGKNRPLPYFSACLARAESFRRFAISNMTGTSGRKRIDAKILETYSLPVPAKEILDEFESKVGKLFKKMNDNAEENDELSNLRDWLLPMLMNGQITVK